MRVIAGTAKGLAIKAPKGKGLRPTSDKVRGALFSILASTGADLEWVLDLYAGTGALGIEALSRGAQHCDFVEQNTAACAAIRENLARTGFTDRAKVHCRPVQSVGGRLQGSYTLIVADPPYDDMMAVDTVFRLASSLLRVEDSLLVLEHSSRYDPPKDTQRLVKMLSRRYGDTVVSIYKPIGGED
jgi:16S rRNA (guanine(966)-N(2))-methyltransferase RsmD